MSLTRLTMMMETNMRWDGFRRSDNVEDRRGDSGTEYADASGMSGRRLGGGGGKLGIGTILILGVVGYALGIDPRLLIGGAELLSGGGSSSSYTSPQPTQSRAPSKPGDKIGDFAAAILGNNEDVWKVVLKDQANVAYEAPRMVLFSGLTRSACGAAQSAMGPFYCPVDKSVYIDLSFFEEMQTRFRAGGDFAYAYVIAHEVGHHIENQLGILPKVQARQREVGQVEANQLSVRVELMADCLAGVWAHHSDKKYSSLEPGDVEEAMNAAQAIGDDRLQRASQGRVVPDSFTHGTSEQRLRWFMTGLKQGDLRQCDTFKAQKL
jgi:uncharacterized protein